MTHGRGFMLVGVACACVVASCALAGYDLDGYGPATTGGDGGAGGASSSRGSHTVSAGSGGHHASSSSDATSTVSAGGSGTENCTNGADDDENGLVDCAEPSCKTLYHCEGNPGFPFGRPVAFYHGDVAVPCPPGYAQQVFVGQTVPQGPAICSACACDAGPCTTAVVSNFGPGCSVVMASTQITNGQCAQFVADTFSVTAPKANGGVPCHESGGMVLPATDPVERAVLCAPVQYGAGCGAGSCIREPAAPFADATCYVAPGDVACPGGMAKTLVATGVSDGRTCSPCTCGGPQLSCSGTLDAFSMVGCAGAATTVPVPADCVTAMAKSVRMHLDSPCQPLGGSTEGAVTANADTQTVCCASAGPL